MREERPIIALDFATVEEVTAFLSLFPKEEKLYVKIGMELYYAQGPEIIRYVKSLGHSVFLDLKLHDIPNTVYSAMKVLKQLEIDMATVQAAGGVEMLKAAREGLGEGPILLAVTQLTSTSEQQMREDQNIQSSLLESVLHYAKRAAKVQLDGVVCSAHEVERIKAETPNGFVCLTPGIRPKGSAVGDQKRVMTPAQARIIGSDYIVVGRPITQAEDPVAAYQAIKAEWTS
ncbi:orotidine-5'-phosphate decarboxylase [Streptococcus dysgalactiae]|uniref:Orotidine 5'-phosphate decarboxylase n=1 Tax=Streptococcus dysgalactiae subsp. dysgalactiae TaxID=99822 RepID=A0A380JVB1_STRDY|nr:orotidine-5'-phosphate decarboxylase [Streptococcus dysgalactiae]EFY02834.1 orotidine 5'-phosphate decarboxylase [Streptococcus dysgalactiae subsp. dysgalactiae ATCC 27957]MCB2830400.1 orotidine-5'-phosphate decarboxylase [Streptococcus dysgalactiae subsp. dysgalactiae]MCB2832271.1 orotidine-5'-phosphate decarboxylase [Streptococcus dysgalactiae subsp. dysgalactiae]MCB2838172.1 orotidine-5'-phosphate decarboxylase [Streptococcus dysgalactiae subsp. dysgalactiae]MCB2840068.1 orotidine-5'-pho